MSERVVEHEWREQAFDQPAVEQSSHMYGLDALDREIQSLGVDLNDLADLISIRTEHIQGLRKAVADIARTLR